MLTIRGEWVNLAMGSILMMSSNVNYLAFYLFMFKDTFCRKITYNLINNFSILSRMSLIKKRHMVTIRGEWVNLAIFFFDLKIPFI